MAALFSALFLFFLMPLVCGGIGVAANRKSGCDRPVALFFVGFMAGFIAAIVVGLLVGLVSRALAASEATTAGIALILWGAGGPVVAYFVCTWAAARLPRKVAPVRGAIAMTADGQAVYPIIGYTVSGQPITADRVAGGGFNLRTNSLAIVTLVLAFVAAPLAIPFGHVSRSQIRETGEQGAGIALAGLIVGYVLTVVWVIALLGLLSAYG